MLQASRPPAVRQACLLQDRHGGRGFRLTVGFENLSQLASRTCLRVPQPAQPTGFENLPSSASASTANWLREPAFECLSKFRQDRQYILFSQYSQLNFSTSKSWVCHWKCFFVCKSKKAVLTRTAFSANQLNTYTPMASSTSSMMSFTTIMPSLPLVFTASVNMA